MPMSARAAITLLAALAACANAQGMRYPVSERGSVTQSIAFTEVVIIYGRPSARGRVLFGDTGVVKYGRIWHPGADSATRITFSKDVELEGHAVKAGEYSIWLIPRDGAAWTFILSRRAHVFHTQYPGESNDALRVDITPERGAYMETLAYYFPAVARDSATLRLHWGETFLPVRITAPAPM
jgi:hypothetical protein